MGYYSDFYLSIPEELPDEVPEELDPRNWSEESVRMYHRYGKWYCCKDEMLTVSLNYPGTLWVLRGVGEDHPDLWAGFYLDGLSYTSKATIVIDPFDPDKLK